MQVWPLAMAEELSLAGLRHGGLSRGDQGTVGERTFKAKVCQQGSGGRAWGGQLCPDGAGLQAPVLQRMGRAHWEGGGGSWNVKAVGAGVSPEEKRACGKGCQVSQGALQERGARWPLAMGKNGRLAKRDQGNVGKPFQGKGLPGKTMPWAPAWTG